MKVLITGNMAYVGSVLVPSLAGAFPGSELIGFETRILGIA